ncbi:Uncharacterised protein [Yersinia frederiksenii]|nr:Uncharacterised protein [Yersinia frederiksenii]
MDPSQCNLFGISDDIALCQRIIEGQLAAAIQLDIPLTGIEVTEVNTYPFITGHQTDAIGIHPAQCTGINRHFGDISFALQRTDMAGRVHPVATGNQREVLRIKLGVNLSGTADN